jgi:hypothetical protein
VQNYPLRIANGGHLDRSTAMTVTTSHRPLVHTDLHETGGPTMYVESNELVTGIARRRWGQFVTDPPWRPAVYRFTPGGRPADPAQRAPAGDSRVAGRRTTLAFVNGGNCGCGWGWGWGLAEPRVGSLRAASGLRPSPDGWGVLTRRHPAFASPAVSLTPTPTHTPSPAVDDSRPVACCEAARHRARTARGGQAKL